ncbi:MAG: hypothetical protein R3E31_13130 [Chloroflexota bacterium]
MPIWACTVVLQRSKLYGLLAFVFFFCAVIIIIPIHFHKRQFKSPTFISYMGTRQSDMRIDFRQSDDVADRFETAVAEAHSRSGYIAKLSTLVTSQFKVMPE